ncbi:MAG: alpha/beta hydrolase [Acidimicrobiales bacterium]|nr:alpha/beta hydrolase [Acidimicrobiales bacterium]MCB1261952.1 alpha/beta hydrolase [Acidimicrobiales bacterium]
MSAADLPLHPNAPRWFREAVAVPHEDRTVVVDDCPIHYLAWGEPGRRGLLFVHGGGAHAHWWTHVAARFADEYRVLAIDLSGHGDSGHRTTYAFEQWTDEVMAVAADGDIDGLPVIVGHSMGGFVTIATSAMHPDKVSGAIICDSPVTEPDPEVESFRLKEAFGRPRTYPSVDDALARFRTVPPQAHYLDYVMDYVGRHSMRPVDDGWQWKFDRTIFEQFAGSLRGVALPYLSRIVCRLALLRSEQGLVTPDIGSFMYEQLGRVTPVIELPLAGHHAMLDTPLILLTALRTLLADWDHSEPHRRR